MQRNPVFIFGADTWSAATSGKHATESTFVHEWHAMGSLPCPWLLPITRPDGDLDIDTTVQYLKDAGFKCNVYLIQKAEKKVATKIFKGFWKQRRTPISKRGP